MKRPILHRITLLVGNAWPDHIQTNRLQRIRPVELWPSYFRLITATPGDLADGRVDWTTVHPQLFFGQ